jgi:hypothetical protein
VGDYFVGGVWTTTNARENENSDNHASDPRNHPTVRVGRFGMGRSTSQLHLIKLSSTNILWLPRAPVATCYCPIGNISSIPKGNHAPH